MFNKNIGVEYNDLLANYNEIIKYVGKNSDSFSMISNLNKPYSKNPPSFEHEKAVIAFEPFLEQYFVGIKKWPGTITKENHKVMLLFRLCKESRKLLKETANLFLPFENGLPEDVCFYRNQNPWFVTVSHEKMAFIADATKEDVSFLKDNGIRIYD